MHAPDLSWKERVMATRPPKTHDDTIHNWPPPPPPIVAAIHGSSLVTLIAIATQHSDVALVAAGATFVLSSVAVLAVIARSRYDSTASTPQATTLAAPGSLPDQQTGSQRQ
jgi:hypothetical protein